MSSCESVPRTASKYPLVPPPKLVLFDLDDTLCDYAAARAGRLRTAFAIALDQLGADAATIDLDHLVVESIAIHPHGSDHFESLLGRYGVNDRARVHAARQWFHRNRFCGLKLFEGAVALLTEIRNEVPGRRVGLITNGPAEVQRDKIALLNLMPFVDFALISGVFGSAKPEPAIFAEALRLGEATCDQAVMIGDSVEFDVLGARAAGIETVWVNRPGSPWPDESPPPLTVRSFAEIRSLFGVPERR